MSIAQAKAGIAQSEQSAGESISQLQGAMATIDQAITTMQTAIQGTSHSSAEQAIAHYQQAKSKLEEAITMVQSGIASGQQYSASL
ncbi:MAG: hypothetical protein ACRDT6_23675 [Micromonosporaceae bacterium]